MAFSQLATPELVSPEKFKVMAEETGLFLQESWEEPLKRGKCFYVGVYSTLS